MNLLILRPDDLTAPGKASVYQDDRRFKHLSSVLKADSGKLLKVGLLDGEIGSASITSATSEKFDLEFTLGLKPPAPLPVKLILALPRPKVVLRALQSATSLGVKEIYLLNAFKVEKAFWSCEQLASVSIEKSLLLGLEQARDTLMPKVHLKKRFKPFVEDELSALSENSNRVVAHPTSEATRLGLLEGPQTIVIGPEGGFIPYEIEMLQAHGFKAVNLGPRILKSETAMISVLSRIQITYP